MAPQHEHGFPTFLVELFEEEEGFLFEAEAALLVAVHDVECVLPPVVVDVVAFEGLERGDVLVESSVSWRMCAASGRSDFRVDTYDW